MSKWTTKSCGMGMKGDDKDLTPKISKSDQEMLERAQRLAANKQVEWRGGYSKEAQLKKGKKTK